MKAYTPGLKVVASCRHRCRRQLPLSGEVLVEVGERVGAQTVVARTNLPGAVLPVNLAQALGIEPSEVPQALQVAIGGEVAAGQLLGRSAGFWGWFRREFFAPAAGTVETVSRTTGQVMLRGPSRPLEVRAYLAGEVVEVLPSAGVVLEAPATLVQGIFGVGGEAYGVLELVGERQTPTVEPAALTTDLKGKLVVVGGRVTADLLRAAQDVGVSALIGGGIDDADLRDFLGYDLGVATTGDEDVGLTLIVTEGFGDVTMAERTWSLLRSRRGAEGACTGATQIRAGVLRPEIVLPWVAGEAPPETTALLAEESGELRVGAQVRIIRDPYFGLIGEVRALPFAPQLLASGARARVLEVAIPGRDPLVVPRANVELIEG
jgi:hypothetical protein